MKLVNFQNCIGNLDQDFLKDIYIYIYMHPQEKFLQGCIYTSCQDYKSPWT